MTRKLTTEIRIQQVNIRLSETEFQEMRKYAKKFGYNSVSEYLRQIAVYEYPALRETNNDLTKLTRMVKDISDKLGVE